MSSKTIYNYESFVYKWTNDVNGKVYIGKHKGTPDDGYISSGRAFLDSYHAHPLDFTREILWYGDDKHAYKKEWDYIKEAAFKLGWKNLYNLTHWNQLKEWKRTCLHCGSICDPRNEEWANDFEANHFEKCKLNPINILIENDKNNIGQTKEKHKYELSLCKSDNERAIVNRFYRYINDDSSLEKEIIRLRKIIDKKLYQ